MLLADVRSVGVQGDGRTYGHPIVLRPVSSEDAMTADWTRLPYDVLARISNRITNEVREVNRVVLDVTSQAAGDHRVGMILDFARALVTVLPDADYLVLSSRLIPGLDGGYTVATLGHARLLEAAGATRALLLTVDPGTPDDHAEHRREFVARGDAASVDRFRNLFDDALADPTWLRAAAVAGGATSGVEYRTVTDAAGTAILSIPVIAGDPDWHLTEASCRCARRGDPPRIRRAVPGVARAMSQDCVPTTPTASSSSCASPGNSESSSPDGMTPACGSST